MGIYFQDRYMFLYRVALAHLGKGKLELPCNPGDGYLLSFWTYIVIGEGEWGGRTGTPTLEWGRTE